MNLLNMPLVPLRRILYWMSLTELFLISFASRRLRDIIAHLLIDTSIDLTAKQGDFELDVVHTGEVTKKLRFSTLYPTTPCTEKKFSVVLGNQTIKLSLIYECHMDRFFVYLKKKYVPSMISAGLPYLRDLFEPDDINIYVSARKMQNLVPTMSVARMTIPDKSIKANHLEDILSKITVLHHMRILTKVTGELAIDSRLNNVRQLHTCGKWMKPAQILNFAGEHAFFSNTRFQTENIIAFLRKWLNGEIKELITLIVHSKVKFDASFVTEQFETSEWNPEERARHYPYPSEISVGIRQHHLQNICDCDVGYDIKRENGRLATFKISSNHFIFFVWFNRFPRRAVNHGR